MKPSTLIAFGFCLVIAAIFFVADRLGGGSGVESADAPPGQALSDQRSRSPSGEQGGLQNRPIRARAPESALRPEVQRVIEQVDLLAQSAIDVDPGSPGATVAVNSALMRLKSELFVKFGEAGGTSRELLNWLSGVIESGSGNEYALRMIVYDTVREASKTPGRAATDWLMRQPDSEFIEADLFEPAFRSWLTANRSEALDWLDQNLDNDRVQNQRWVILEWPESDVKGARAWVERRMDVQGNSMAPCYVSDVARLWARQDPDGAFDWMSSLDQRWHNWGFLGIAQGLPESELSRASDWISENRDVGRVLDDTRSTVANRIADSDPRTAIDIAADITSIAKSDSVIITAARILYDEEPQLVLDWLPGSGLSEVVQAAIISDE